MQPENFERSVGDWNSPAMICTATASTNLNVKIKLVRFLEALFDFLFSLNRTDEFRI